MNWLDYVLIFILILNFYNGLRYGFVRQIVGMASLFIALYLALFWSGDLRIFFEKNLRLGEVISVLVSNGDTSLWLTGVLLNIISFLVLFALVTFILTFFCGKLKYLNRIPIIGTLNVLLGGLFGAVKGVIIVFLIIALISLIPTGYWINTLDASVVVALFGHYMPLLYSFIVDYITGRLV